MIDTVFTGPASLGQGIRDARKALKITTEDLALQTGISRTTSGAIEHGQETAHGGRVLQQCRNLGMCFPATCCARKVSYDDAGCLDLEGIGAPVGKLQSKRHEEISFSSTTSDLPHPISDVILQQA